MTQEEIAANLYRFEGYQLPMLELDETGNSYVKIDTIHPYYKNQPLYWKKPYYNGHPYGTGNIATPAESSPTPAPSGFSSGLPGDIIMPTSDVYPMLKLR